MKENHRMPEILDPNDADFYDLDSYLFKKVTRKFEKEGTLNSFDFYAIVTWKANRAKTKVLLGLKTKGLSPNELMSRVHDISNNREKMQFLANIPGIGTPIASAILTVCYPERFTVIDYRAWETLLHFGHVLAKTMPTDIDGYFDKYLPVCKSLANDMKLSLRDLDLVLWGRSQRISLEEIAAI
jgi:thermostable 8-oxoguanine DNA glycosylase